MTTEITPELKKQLRREVPALSAEIRKLYRSLDERFGLHGADVPVTFGFDPEVLGSYTAPGDPEKKEQFYFSLLFIGYLHTSHLHIEDKMDLYRHEYAHYMAVHMEIPKEYAWQSGRHGSAWKYCCSLTGAVPSPYYSFGKGLIRQDYDKVLKDPMKNPHVQLLDTARREKAYQDSRNRVVKYAAGDVITHPEFGEGIVEAVTQTDSSVRLTIRFGETVKKIDQKWLLRSQYKKR